MPDRIERQQPQHISSGEYWTTLITMIVGGLAYSIISFSYMHSTFSTQKSQDKYEDGVRERLNRIEDKLDKALDGRRR